MPYFFGIGLHVFVAIFFAVHAMRNNQGIYWLFILFAFPLLGSVVYFVAIGIPVPLLWWLVLPHTVAIGVVLGVIELAIVFGGLFAIFRSKELSELPRYRPVQAPSTKGLS